MKKKNWDWPYSPRGELYCKHGIGHGGLHGCDGCCSKDKEGFEKAEQRELSDGKWMKK